MHTMRQIANMVLSQARAISQYSSRIGNMFLSFAKGIASFDNSELIVEIGNHNFDVKFVPAKHNKQKSWHDYYTSGNIYFKQYANPVKIRPPSQDEIEENEIDLIPSEKYRIAMQMQQVRQAFDTGKEGLDLIHKLLLANIGVLIMIAVILAVMLS